MTKAPAASERMLMVSVSANQREHHISTGEGRVPRREDQRRVQGTGTAAALCSALAERGISLDAIVQSERQHGDGSRDISFILRKEDRSRADVALAPLLAQWPGAALEEGESIARVSAVGAGMPATPGTAGRMFRALADAGINIALIATSEIRTSCVVAEQDGVAALQAVHTGFGLGGQEQHTAQGSASPLES